MVILPNSKDDELIYISKIQMLKGKFCPKCKSIDCINVYDKIEEDTHIYDFICLDCSAFFTLIVDLKEYFSDALTNLFNLMESEKH